MTDHIGVFGAAFDPPHRGHFDVIRQALARLDSVLLVPAAAHAFGKQMSDFQHRLSMTQLACATWLSETEQHRVQVCGIEQQLPPDSRGAITTWALLNALQLRHPDAALTFILGPDNVDAWHHFHRAKEIDARFQRFNAQERIQIRSSELRGAPRDQLIPQVGPAVADYIGRHALYATTEHGRQHDR